MEDQGSEPIRTRFAFAVLKFIDRQQEQYLHVLLTLIGFNVHEFHEVKCRKFDDMAHIGEILEKFKLLLIFW